MVPADRDPPAIVGTISYDAADLKLLESQLGQSTPMPLWRAALAASGLGAVIGFGVVALAQRVMEPEIEFFSGLGPWGALVGAIAAVSAGAAYLSRKARRRFRRNPRRSLSLPTASPSPPTGRTA